jgi:glycerol-1-phosphate dehydrogenase [NAD(P)+]
MPAPEPRFPTRSIAIPDLVRIKPGALDRVGIYLGRSGCRSAVLYHSNGLPESLRARLRTGLSDEQIQLHAVVPIADASRQSAEDLAERAGSGFQAIVGLGGGKALDAAKFISWKLQVPCYAVPTSLSNDGFCSPQSSLTVDGRRVSVNTTMPSGVVVDTEVCLQAPKRLWLSGVGDLVSKLTAVRDWKLAFHERGTPVDDFAALLSDASVYQFIGKPDFTPEGTRLLATALMLNGISMAVSGSSRPASGSEHLISHALDSFGDPPRLHGFQVGIATYLVSQLHGQHTATIDQLFQRTGFWNACAEQPFDRDRWAQAIRRAPKMKQDFYTILSRPGQVDKLLSILDRDPVLRPCFEPSPRQSSATQTGPAG